MNFSDAQKEIQDLLHNKEGWNVTVLARKAGKSPQTMHNQLYQNADLSANDYLLYKKILTAKTENNYTIADLKEKCFETIEMGLILEQDLSLFTKDNVITTEELESLKARKRVLVQTLERFISYCEQRVNEVMG